MSEYIVTKKSYLSIPFSVALHLIFVLLVSGYFVAKQKSENKNQKITVIEFEPEQKETGILVDKGIKSNKAGANRGVQNQEAMDLAENISNRGENYNDNGIADKQLSVRQNEKESITQPQQPMQNTDAAEKPNNENADQISDLRKSPKKISLTTSSIFRSKNEMGAKNLESSSGKYGSFTLSSYEWEYAPYMLSWIEKIKNKWVEPISYLAGKGKGGQVVVRVSVLKSGIKKKIEMIFSNVNDEMTNEAVKAVESSFNLPNLPESFKDNELVVTFSMIYPAY